MKRNNAVRDENITLQQAIAITAIVIIKARKQKDETLKFPNNTKGRIAACTKGMNGN